MNTVPTTEMTVRTTGLIITLSVDECETLARMIGPVSVANLTSIYTKGSYQRSLDRIDKIGVLLQGLFDACDPVGAEAGY